MGSQPDRTRATAKVVVATTVALSFISFWRGAAIVLSDLASTMFYVGGIVERAIGKPAPWFVIGVMLFSFAVRSVYLESCSMFVRGGVYVVVRDSLGPFMGKLSVSALVVDYVLTGPISSVSAGQYLGRLFNELSGMAGMGLHIDPSDFATFFGVGVTSYFWWMNTRVSTIERRHYAHAITTVSGHSPHLVPCYAPVARRCQPAAGARPGKSPV